MPDLTVVVSGTGTGVGKTWVAARLARTMRDRGIDVAARKPVQSFDPADHALDAGILAAATGENVAAVCSPEHSYPMAVAPPMAAAALGLPAPTLDGVVRGLDLPRRGVAIVEGVGGPRSPLVDDGDTVDLAAAVDADVVIVVSDPGLGALNQVLLARDAFAPRAVIAHLNRFRVDDPIHHANRSWLEDRCGVAVTTSVSELIDRICIHRPLEVT